MYIIIDKVTGLEKASVRGMFAAIRRAEDLARETGNTYEVWTGDGEAVVKTVYP